MIELQYRRRYLAFGSLNMRKVDWNSLIFMIPRGRFLFYALSLCFWARAFSLFWLREGAIAILLSESVFLFWLQRYRFVFNQERFLLFYALSLHFTISRGRYPFLCTLSLYSYRERILRFDYARALFLLWLHRRFRQVLPYQTLPGLYGCARALSYVFDSWLYDYARALYSYVFFRLIFPTRPYRGRVTFSLFFGDGVFSNIYPERFSFDMLLRYHFSG